MGTEVPSSPTHIESLSMAMETLSREKPLQLRQRFQTEAVLKMISEFKTGKHKLMTNQVLYICKTYVYDICICQVCPEKAQPVLF